MLKSMIAKKKILVIVTEIIVFLAYALFSVATYEQTELTFTVDDMQLQDMERNYIDGEYLDTSFEGIKAVVTPAFQVKKGIYYIEASYAVQGSVKVGLIYDAKRKNEIVGDYEPHLNPRDGNLSYRFRIYEDSPIRFKMRLTGDAVEGDYVQMMQVHIFSSELTYIYRIFCLAVVLLFLNLLIWGYYRVYRKWSAESKIIFLVLGIMAFLMGIPYYRNGLQSGADLPFHLYRIRGLCNGLLAGQFPVRIQPGWLNGYGYASSIFYGDIFLYFPAILHMAGFTLQDSYKCYMVAVNIATVCTSFYSFRKISKNDIAAMTAGVLYVGSMRRLSVAYSTVAVGCYSAMMFHPLVMAGFYLIFTEDEQSKEYKNLWVLLTLGFTGLLMTHMISCLMVGGYAVLCCLLMIKKVFRKNTLIELLKAAGAAVLLNLWFLIPFIQYMMSEKLHINVGLSQSSEITDYASEMSGYMIHGKNLYGLFMDSNSIGYALICVLLLYIVTMPLQKKGKLTKYSRVFFGCTLFSLWVCTKLFPVVGLVKISNIFVKYFSTIQHQDRFISVATCFICCLGALLLGMEGWNRKDVYAIAGLLCCITLFQDFHYFETVEAENVYLDGDFEGITSEVGNGEYIPVMHTGNPTEEIEKDEALQIQDVQRNYLTFDITVTNPTEQEQQIFLPVLYYSGYKAYDIQGKAELKTFQGDNGRVAVSVPADYKGTFHMAYYVPWYWRVSEVISLVALLFILYYIFKGKEHTCVWKLKRLQIKRSENTAG